MEPDTDPSAMVVAGELALEVRRAERGVNELSVVFVQLFDGDRAAAPSTLAQEVTKALRCYDSCLPAGQCRLALILPGANDDGRRGVTRRLRGLLGSRQRAMGGATWQRDELGVQPFVSRAMQALHRDPAR